MPSIFLLLFFTAHLSLWKPLWLKLENEILPVQQLNHGSVYQLKLCDEDVRDPSSLAHQFMVAHVLHVSPNRIFFCFTSFNTPVVRPTQAAAHWLGLKQVANPNKHRVKESSEQTEISTQHDTIGLRTAGTPVLLTSQGVHQGCVCICVCMCGLMHILVCTSMSG